jgi:hypothetical protein
MLRDVQPDETRLFKTFFDWYQEMPGFLKHLQDLRGRHETLDEFCDSMVKGYNYVGLENGEPKAMVHGELHDDGTVEGHLICKPGTDPDLAVATITFSKMRTLERSPIIVCQILRKHRFLIEAMERSGFKDSGMRAYQGVYRGKLQEVLYYVAAR